jgi:hypothetical protein
MVARAQFSDFTIFMRKIGYSVGLEHTLARVGDFARLYGGQEAITIGDVKRLLHAPPPEGWNLQPQNEHILDFLRSIEVLSVRGGEVGVLELGEALGILWKTLPIHAFPEALRLLLTHELILADGDVFLNALAAQFDETAFAASMTRVLEHKWSILEQTFKSPQQRAAIYKSVNIETQDNNPGSRGLAGARTGPLDATSTTRSGPLSPKNIGRPPIRISPNYVVKTLGRRRAWAASLGLANDSGAPTVAGERLLQTLVTAGYAGPSCIATWPLAHELIIPLFTSMRLPPDVPVRTSWDFMVLVGRGLGLLGSGLRACEQSDMSTVLDVIRTFHSLNQSRSIVRNEVPVRVAYRCLLAYAIGNSKIPDYPTGIKQEQGSPSPLVVSRSSRVAELALSEAR